MYYGTEYLLRGKLKENPIVKLSKEDEEILKEELILQEIYSRPQKKPKFKKRISLKNLQNV